VAPANDAGPQLFQANHNRKPGTGEYIVVLQPRLDDRGLVMKAEIRVYRGQGAAGPAETWTIFKTLNVHYEGL
jgi:hypothetical protein